ncbi:MAG: TolC family protein [Chryseolinea sp.]
MKKILYTLSLLLIVQFSQAQVNNELKTWIQQSFTHFPKLKELEKTSELGEIRIDVAQSNYLPNINGTASYSYVNPVSQKTFGAPGAESLLQFQPYNNYNFNVGLNQVLWDFGKTQAQIEKAKTELLITKQNTEVAKLQLATQVTSIYYSIIYLKKSIELQDSVIGFYNQNKKIIEGKIKQGDGLQVDLSNIESNISQEKNRRLEFQRQLDRQAALLAYTTGLNTQPTSTDLNFPIALTASPTTINNPELLVAGQKITSAQSDQKLALQNRLPTLNFQAGAGFKNGYQPEMDKIRFNYLAGVSLSVPIFQGHRIQQNIILTRKTVELNELSKSNLESSLQKDLESVNADLIAYHEQIINSQAQIDAAREALRLTQVRYTRGVSTYLDLIFASTNMQRGLLNQWQFEYQQCLAKAELARLEGRKFWEE